MEITEKMAKFIVETDFEKLPSEAVSSVKNALLDTLGVTFAGSAEPVGKIITEFVNKMDCKPTASVIGSKIRTSSPNAALANGTMAHALDYDDRGAGNSQGHPSSPLLPTVFALGEELGASGKKIITAYAIGVEVWSRIASCMPLFHLKGWHPTGVFGTLGASAAAANLLKLNLEQTVMALGLAGSQAAGVGQNFGSMTKPFHAGNAAKNGITAAMLTKDGFTATKDILEGPFGFPVTFYGGEVELSKMVLNLGNPFMVSPGLDVKKYPTCYFTHKAIDATLDLVNKHDEIKPDQVEAVDCEIPYRAIKVLFYTDPQNKLESKFCMQFALAVAIVDHEVGLDQVTDKKVKDPLIQELMKKINMHAYSDAEFETRADKVTIKLKNGKKYSQGVQQARGHHDVPLPRDELLAKYQECAKKVLNREDIQRSIELLESLEELEDIRELMDITRSR